LLRAPQSIAEPPPLDLKLEGVAIVEVKSRNMTSTIWKNWAVAA
jgi:hypothetical protein